MQIPSPTPFAPQHPAAQLDRLGDEIAELSAHLDAATARLLELIREFDARGGWNTGFCSCAAWLSWRVGLDLGAARERVRVARALGTLPLLAHALARGELSYAKVRALTRVATPETEARLLAVGRAGTAAHVERIVRGWRCVDRRAEAREAKRRHATRALHVYQDEDGMVVIRGRLEPEVGALLLQALVRMHPVGTRMAEGEIIGVALPRRQRRLADFRHAVLLVGRQQAMPVDQRVLRQPVLELDAKAPVGRDGQARRAVGLAHAEHRRGLAVDFDDMAFGAELDGVIGRRRADAGNGAGEAGDPGAGGEADEAAARQGGHG